LRAADLRADRFGAVFRCGADLRFEREAERRLAADRRFVAARRDMRFRVAFRFAAVFLTVDFRAAAFFLTGAFLAFRLARFAAIGPPRPRFLPTSGSSDCAQAAAAYQPTQRL
jgi:hypothetical protein